MATRNATGDMPVMSNSSVANYSYDTGAAAGGFVGVTSTAADDFYRAGREIRAGARIMKPRPPVVTAEPEEDEKMNEERVVQVYVCDLDKNLPMNKRLIWKSEPIFTDLGDNDLWFDMAAPVTEKLTEHNKYRLTVRDKAVKDREQMLEAIRPCDLAVNVTVLAQFQKKA